MQPPRRRREDQAEAGEEEEQADRDASRPPVPRGCRLGGWGPACRGKGCRRRLGRRNGGCGRRLATLARRRLAGACATWVRPGSTRPASPPRRRSWRLPCSLALPGPRRIQPARRPTMLGCARRGRQPGQRQAQMRRRRGRDPPRRLDQSEAARMPAISSSARRIGFVRMLAAAALRHEPRQVPWRHPEVRQARQPQDHRPACPALPAGRPAPARRSTRGRRPGSGRRRRSGPAPASREPVPPAPRVRPRRRRERASRSPIPCGTGNAAPRAATIP